MIDKKVVDEAWEELMEKEKTFHGFCDAIINGLFQDTERALGGDTMAQKRASLISMVDNIEYRRNEMIRANEFWRQLKRLAEERESG